MSRAVIDDGSMATAAPGGPELPELLRVFNEVSGRLAETHRRLEERVAGLQRELAEAHEGLRRSRALAALGEMAAGIAHEVRNPLASIALHAEVLREDLADRPDERAVLDKIARAVARLDSIVGDVLRFARTSCSRRDRMSVRSMVGEALASCEAEIHAGGVEVLVDVDDALEIRADGAAITQAIVNLVRNAIEAVGEGPVARRRVRIDGERRERLGADGRRTPVAVIGVEDGGPGFDPSVVDRVFTPFVTTRESGTGLGLAIVHRIVDAHDGAVAVASRSRTGGARVELLLPAPGPECESGADGGESARDRSGADGERSPAAPRVAHAHAGSTGNGTAACAPAPNPLDQGGELDHAVAERLKRTRRRPRERAPGG